jgi:hypothetical protein
MRRGNLRASPVVILALVALVAAMSAAAIALLDRNEIGSNSTKDKLTGADIHIATRGRSDTEGYPWRKGISAAKRYARRRAGEISFAVVDEDGRLRGQHVNRVHYAASVVKAMFLVAYLRQTGVRDRELDSSDRRLLGPMIKRSDNEAAFAVYTDVGDQALLKLATVGGMKHFNPDSTWPLSEITASDQARFFYRIDRYVPKRHRSYAMRLLQRIVPNQRWGIPAAAPEGWTVQFKGGWLSWPPPGWIVNQVALLHKGPRRLALAVLTVHSRGMAYGTETIEGVTRRLVRGYERSDAGPSRGSFRAGSRTSED